MKSYTKGQMFYIIFFVWFISFFKIECFILVECFIYRAWSYGGIGTIAGREIFHGFGTRGTCLFHFSTSNMTRAIFFIEYLRAAISSMRKVMKFQITGLSLIFSENSQITSTLECALIVTNLLVKKISAAFRHTGRREML